MDTKSPTEKWIVSLHKNAQMRRCLQEVRFLEKLHSSVRLGSTWELLVFGSVQIRHLVWFPRGCRAGIRPWSVPGQQRAAGRWCGLGALPAGGCSPRGHPVAVLGTVPPPGPPPGPTARPRRQPARGGSGASAVLAAPGGFSIPCSQGLESICCTSRRKMKAAFLHQTLPE